MNKDESAIVINKAGLNGKPNPTEERLAGFDIGFGMKASPATGEKPPRRGKRD